MQAVRSTPASSSCGLHTRAPACRCLRTAQLAVSARGQTGSNAHRARRALVKASSEDFAMATKQLKETAAMDELIDVLMASKSQQELMQKVAENILSFDQKFWLRLAARSDTAASSEDKQKLQALASTVMTLVDAMVRKTETQLKDSATVLQDVLAAAADERGEWQLPLRADAVAAMRKAMDEREAFMDEALLSNAYAWMHKAADDKLDGMVALLQKVLQLYAAKRLTVASTEPVDVAVNRIIQAEENDWENIISEIIGNEQLSESSFMDALQRRMENIVLGLASGSYAQRVQAEYLKELERRAKLVFQKAA